MFKMEEKVRDRITGFAGLVTGRTEWLNGCVRYCVTSQMLHDNKPIDGQWFDEEQLEGLDELKVPPPPDSDKAARPGGPQSDPVYRGSTTAYQSTAVKSTPSKP